MTVTTAAALGLDPHLPLSEPAAEAWLPHTCFKHGPPGQLGLELELIPVPAGPLPAGGLAGLHAVLRQLPLRSALTIEPGGQVELSSPPAPGLPAAMSDLAADLRLLRGRAGRLGWCLLGAGLDPRGIPDRVLHLPRYAAMEAYLDRWGTLPGCGPSGRAMMRATASVQVNLEAATSADGPGQRWELLHAIGPTLVAAFANSPVQAGRPTGWKSTRQAVWLALDPARTRAPRPRGGEGPQQAWARWCLDAPVMIVRRPRGPWTAPPGLTFREWIRFGRRAVPDRPPPVLDDLAYHLTTVFPPVRARGHLEVRCLDAQPGPWWAVPPAVLAALVDDAAAADQARDACSGLEDRWEPAARHGLGDRQLARAARRLFELAAATLARHPGTTAAGRAVEAYAERWTVRRRCPADDLLTTREEL
jgi:glutamate--cysteine ligase